MRLKDRIVDFQRLPARDLQDNAGNWRLHPAFQRRAVGGLLEQIGIVEALLAYPSARNGGALTLIDGHLRKSLDPDQVWPVRIADLTDEEADLVLTVLAPSAALAQAGARLEELLDRVQADDLAVRELLHQQREALVELADDAQNAADLDNEPGPPEMELQPFEQYDYIVLLFRSTLDFDRACDVLGIEMASWEMPELKSFQLGEKRALRKVGVGRAVDGARVMNRFASALDVGPAGNGAAPAQPGERAVWGVGDHHPGQAGSEDEE